MYENISKSLVYVFTKRGMKQVIFAEIKFHQTKRYNKLHKLINALQEVDVSKNRSIKSNTFLNKAFHNVDNQNLVKANKTILSKMADREIERLSEIKKTFVHGGAIIDLGNNMIAFSMHTSKSLTKIGDVIINNIDVKEPDNSIKLVNPIIIVKKIDFLNYFEIDRNLDNFLFSNRYGGKDYDLFYCALRSLWKAVSSGKDAYHLEFVDDSMELTVKPEDFIVAEIIGGNMIAKEIPEEIKTNVVDDQKTKNISSNMIEQKFRESEITDNIEEDKTNIVENQEIKNISNNVIEQKFRESEITDNIEENKTNVVANREFKHIDVNESYIVLTPVEVTLIKMDKFDKDDFQKTFVFDLVKEIEDIEYRNTVEHKQELLAKYKGHRDELLDALFKNTE